MPVECQQKNSTFGVNLSCAKRFFTVYGEPVNPRVIYELLNWVSDNSGNVITSINLLGAQDSNRFFTGDSKMTVKRIGSFFSIHMQREKKPSDATEPLWFSYTVRGVTQNGIFVLTTDQDANGGTFDYGTILFVRIEKGRNSLSEKNIPLNEVSIIKIGEFGGTASDIKITGNFVKWKRNDEEFKVNLQSF